MNSATSDQAILDMGGVLTERALSRLRKEFPVFDHRPSEEAWNGLRALVCCLEGAAKGLLPPNVYLSSLDCGSGKSTAVIAFLDAMLSLPEFDHVGALVCLNRREEIESYTKRAGIGPNEFAVWTGKENVELNSMGLGKENAQKARVVFSTQSMIQLACDGRRFSDVSELHFNGRKRDVIVWDESLSMAEGVLLSAYDIACLPRRFSQGYPKAVEMIEEAVSKIKAADDGSLLVLPDFDADSDATANDVARLLNEFDEDRRIASALWFLSGRAVSVRRDKYQKTNVAIDFREVLPPDLKPLVCIDASGRVRGTYQSWERWRGDLVRLPSATKSYRNLRCHVWRTSGAKSAFARSERELSEGVAKVINARPNEDILILIHKPRNGRYDIEKTIRGLVTVDSSRLNFLTWGAHTAVNGFSHCRTVIVAGTLFQRATTIEAIARAACGVSASEGSLSREQLSEIEIGESKHHLMQGATRGAMRKSIGNDCSPCDLYIIASERSGIPSALQQVFPHCQVSPWKPFVRPLKGIVKAAVESIEDHAELMSVGDFLPFKTIMSKIGYANSANFSRDVRDNPDFQATIAELGLSEAPKKVGGSRRMGWRMEAFALEFEDETKAPENVKARENAEALGDF